MRYSKKNAILRSFKIVKKIMLLFLAVKMAGVFPYTFFHLVQRCLQLFALFTHHIVSVSTDG